MSVGHDGLPKEPPTFLRALRHPLDALASLWWSWRLGFPGIKLRKNWTSQIVLGKGGRIIIGRRLSLGLIRTRHGEIGRIGKEPASVQIAENGLLTVSGTAHLGPGVRVLVGRKASVTIGDKTFVSARSLIVAESSVRIGAECAISWDVQIMDTDFHQLHGRPSVREVVVGDHVWIGSGVHILKGVSIGEGSVVAAGSVVTKNVPPRSLAAGNPATVVRQDVHWTP